MSQDYNGYSNYETWCVSLWIWDDERLLRYWLDRVVFGNLADELKAWARQPLPDLQGFYADLITSALEVVDWEEIAEALTTEDT